MNTKSLAYFLEACRTLNFTKAAENMFITSQGLTKAIKNLEDDLGHVLFVRTSSGLGLSEYGTILRRHAEEIIKREIMIQQEFKLINKEKTEIKMAIGMGAVQVMGENFTQVLNSLVESDRILYIDSYDLLCEEEILNQNCDLALCGGPIHHKNIVSKTVKRGYMCAFVHETHPLYTSESIEVIQLKDQKIITTNSNYRIYHQFNKSCNYYGFEPNIVATTITLRDTCRLYPDKSVVGISSYLILGKSSYEGYKVIPIKDDKFPWNLELIANKNTYDKNEFKKIHHIFTNLKG